MSAKNSVQRLINELQYLIILIFGSVHKSYAELFKIDHPTIKVANAGQAHTEGLKHHTTSVIAITFKDHEPLIVVNIRGRDKYLFPGVPSFYGGHNGQSSNPLEIAKKEFTEESSMKKLDQSDPSFSKLKYSVLGNTDGYTNIMQWSCRWAIQDTQLIEAQKILNQIETQERNEDEFNRIHCKINLNVESPHYGMVQLYVLADNYSVNQRFQKYQKQFQSLGMPEMHQIKNNENTHFVFTQLPYDMAAKLVEINKRPQPITSDGEVESAPEGFQVISISQFKELTLQAVTDVVAIAIKNDLIEEAIKKQPKPIANPL